MDETNRSVGFSDDARYDSLTSNRSGCIIARSPAVIIISGRPFIEKGDRFLRRQKARLDPRDGRPRKHVEKTRASDLMARKRETRNPENY